MGVEEDIAPGDFDRDTVVERMAEDRWRSRVAPGWDIQGVPNGGYLMALAGRVLAEALPHPEPLSVTGYYVDRAGDGEIDLLSETLRAGRRVSTGAVSVHQDGVERARFLGSYTDLGDAGGPTLIAGGPPDLPTASECVPAVIPINFNRRVDLRLAPRCAGWLQGRPGGPAELAGWVRLADGREPDPLALLMFSDAFPPAVFAHYGPAGWVPTLELTVHVRGRPAPGWLRCVFRTRYLSDGVMEEDGEIWDGDGRLVALSRQLAKLRIPEAGGG